MCGIFALINNTNVKLFNEDISLNKTINDEFMKGKNRGPEFSILDVSYNNMILGFHRLAINGLNDESNQPLCVNNVVLICNGEIYNYKQLYELMGVVPTTDSDCEVILHLYLKYGMEQTLIMIDGVFSFVLYDKQSNDTSQHKLFVSRDPYGVRPLYHFKSTNLSNPFYGFSSELKSIHSFYNNSSSTIHQFLPGTFSSFQFTINQWIVEKENTRYFTPTFSHNINFTAEKEEEALHTISDYLIQSVNKRCLTTERPIACLLSGGLDSSLITALVLNCRALNNLPSNIETYSIGLQGSVDLKCAKIVADYLGTTHTEIVVTEEEMFDIIPELIKTIESYDTTTVRASIGNYLIGKYISTHSDAKVIFNGDGSDELFGGYLYMKKCVDDIEFDKETRRLLSDIYLFDVLRSDKSISSCGLEPRTPFLDKSFVNYVLSLPPSFRNNNCPNLTTVENHRVENHPVKNHRVEKIEKYILRKSFSEKYFKNYKGTQILPDEILWRTKEAFSDGVCANSRSLYQILQERIAAKLNKDNNTTNYTQSIETEKMYYKQIFNKIYPNSSHLLPYYWMPKYSNTNDPSARTLDIYK